MKKLCLSVVFIFLFNLRMLETAEWETYGCNGRSDAFLEARFEAGYWVGQFIGIKQGYVDLGIFIPVSLTKSLMTFIDGRGYKFNNSKWGLSASIGLRNCLSNDRVVGLNVNYDYLEGRFHKSFKRIGFGLEWLGERLDFRVNTYLPLGCQIHSSETVKYDNYQGNYQATCRENQFSISKGVDAEVCYHFWRWNNLTLNAALGPYYYSSKQKKSYFGGQARIEVFYNSIISLEIRNSYDSANQFRTQGQIQISIPFEILKERLSLFCECIILQPLKRNGVIFTENCCDYKWNW